MNNNSLFDLILAAYSIPDKHPEYTGLVESLDKFKYDWEAECDNEEDKADWLTGYLSMLSDALFEEFDIDADIVDIAPYSDLMI